MTLAEFISMGGYGFYVWSSFGMTALLLIFEVVFLKQQRRSNLKIIRRMKNSSSGERNET